MAYSCTPAELSTSRMSGRSGSQAWEGIPRTYRALVIPHLPSVTLDPNCAEDCGRRDVRDDQAYGALAAFNYSWRESEFGTFGALVMEVWRKAFPLLNSAVSPLLCFRHTDVSAW